MDTHDHYQDALARSSTGASTSGSGNSSSGALDPLPPLQRAEAFLAALRAADSYDGGVLEGLTVESASRGRVLCRLPVTDRHANRYGTMHGGCIATLIDVIGTVAIATVADRSGVSLSITVNYLSPGPVGGAVEIESTVAKSGKQNAVAAVELRDAATGALVAFGTHTKAMVPQSDLGPLWALANALELQTQQTQQQGREARSRGGGSLPLLSKL